MTIIDPYPLKGRLKEFPNSWLDVLQVDISDIDNGIRFEVYNRTSIWKPFIIFELYHDNYELVRRFKSNLLIPLDSEKVVFVRCIEIKKEFYIGVSRYSDWVDWLEITLLVIQNHSS